MRTIPYILQSTLLILWVLTYEVYGQTIDQSLCYNSLYNSDTDSDGRLQTDEYVDFISTISEGYITNDQEYSDLSSVLKVNFSHLSCRCKFNPINAGDDCCLLSGENNGIWLIEGFMNHSKNPWPDDEVSNFEIWLEGESTSEEYLLALCEDTMKAINYERRYPTYAPSHYHIQMPIAQATNSPTTNQPTIPIIISSSSPSSHPTMNPVTINPSNNPTTLQPVSRSPSNQPTDWPTWLPTLNPVSVTEKPTISSTEQKDTEIPTDNPTEDTNDALSLQEIFAIGSRSSPSPSVSSIEESDTSTRTSNVEEEEDTQSPDYILIGSIAAASVILFVCCASMACLVKRRRSRNKDSSMTEEEDDYLANVSTFSSSAGDSGWSWGSTNSSKSERIEEGVVVEEEDTSTMDMNWVGVGRIASMLADDTLFKDEDIRVVEDSMKRSRVTKLSKGRKGSPRPLAATVPAIESSDSSSLDKDEEKRRRVKHINSLIGKGDFVAVQQLSKKYNTIEHKEDEDGDQRDRVGSPDSLSDWALIHGGPAL